MRNTPGSPERKTTLALPGVRFMVEGAKPESISQRFGAYIDELREFFATRGLSYGQPADLSAFAAQVAEPGAFQDEMGSMVRTIVYREDDHMGRSELLELVTVAVGGPEVQGGAEHGQQSAVRQIFMFVNAALRQRQESMPEMDEEPEEPLVAGDFLSPHPRPMEPVVAPAPPRMPSSPPLRNEPPAARQSSAQQPAYPSYAQPMWEPLPQPAQELSRQPVARSRSREDMLSRAMALAADEHQHVSAEDRTSRETLRQRWIVPVIAGGLAVIGVGVYLTKPGTHAPNLRKDVVASEQSPAAVIGPSCVAEMAAGTSRSALEERSRWARNLLNEGLYGSALPELREIARLDPGFPGVKLDESDALLHLKRPDDAREAVDAQIATSECLARLSMPALDAYCGVQFPAANVGSCRPQLAHIRQQAELQAAMVHLELGHQVEPEGGASASLAELTRDDATPAHNGVKPEKPRAEAIVTPREERGEPLPPATEGDAEGPALPRTATVHPGAKKGKSDPSLVHGEGTDSVYGAYQKPE